MPKPQTTMTDTELAQLVADPQHIQAAYQLLYERHCPALISFVRGRFPKYADDIVQETWRLTLVKLRQQMPNELRFRAYLFQTAKNQGIDLLRKYGRFVCAPDVEPSDNTHPSAEELLLAQERAAILNQCNEKLKAHYQDQWLAVAGWSAGEEATKVAERLGTSVDNYYQLKSRGLATLRDCAKRNLP